MFLHCVTQQVGCGFCRYLPVMTCRNSTLQYNAVPQYSPQWSTGILIFIWDNGECWERNGCQTLISDTLIKSIFPLFEPFERIWLRSSKIVPKRSEKLAVSINLVGGIEKRRIFLFTVHWPLSIAYCPLFTAHCLLLTAPCTVHCPLFTAHCPLFFCSLPTAHCSPPTVYCSLLTVQCPLPAVYCPLVTTVVCCPLPTAHCHYPLSFAHCLLHCPAAPFGSLCLLSANLIFLNKQSPCSKARGAGRGQWTVDNEQWTVSSRQ